MRLKHGLLLCALSVWSCGQHDDKKDAEAPSPGLPSPVDSGKRTFALRGEYKEKFENWKARLSKSCNIVDAFLDQSSPTRGLDGKLFLNQIKGSLVLKGSAGEFLMLGRPLPALGVETSKITKEDAGGVRLQAEFRRDGAVCEVFMAGEKVYSTEIYQSVPIAAHWYSGKDIKEPVLAYSELRALKNSASGALTNHRFSTSLFTKLRADKRSFQFLGDYFGLGESEVQRIFTEAPTFSIPYSASLPGRNQVLAFDGKRNEIYGPTDLLRVLIDRSVVPIRIQIKPPRFDIEKNGNTEDEKNWVLQATIHVQPAKDAPMALEYSAEAIVLKEPKPFDDSDAMRCMQERLQFVAPLLAPDLPNYKWSAGPCRALSSDFDQALLKDKNLHARFLEFLGRVTPSKGAKYAGWDSLLIKVTKSIIQEGRNLEATLDPDHKVPLIGQLSQSLDEIRDLLKSYPSLQAQAPLFINLATTWALTGENVSRSQILGIFESSANAMEPFPASTLTLLNSLREKPFDHDSELAFAKSLTQPYKDLAKKLSARAKDLGIQDVFESRFSSILQKRLSFTQLQNWQKTLTAIDSFQDREEKRLLGDQGSDRFFFNSHFKDLAARAVDEFWLDKDFNQAEEISQLAGNLISCTRYRSVSSLIHCHGTELYSKSKGMFLDESFGGRYKGLAQEFQGHIQSLVSDDHLFLRRALEQKFFGPVWNTCTNAEFKMKAQGLKDLLKQYKSLTDWFDRNKAERKVRDHLDGCS